MYEKYRDEFQKNGFVIIKGLLPREIVGEVFQAITNFTDTAKAEADKNMVFEKVEGGRHLKYFQHMENYLPSARKLFHSRILAAASAVLGQDTYFTGAGLHNKVPRIGTETPPHQDNFYWCLSPPDALTAYVPLEPQDSSNGGVSYLAGSHKDGVMPHEKGKTAAFSSALVDRQKFDMSKFTRPALEPGDVVLHHSEVVHAAESNSSERNRRAVAIGVFGVNAKLSEKMRAEYVENRTFNREG